MQKWRSCLQIYPSHKKHLTPMRGTGHQTCQRPNCDKFLLSPLLVPTLLHRQPTHRPEITIHHRFLYTEEPAADTAPGQPATGF